MIHLVFLENQLQIFLQLILYLNLQKITSLQINEHENVRHEFFTVILIQTSHKGSPGRHILNYPEEGAASSSQTLITNFQSSVIFQKTVIFKCRNACNLSQNGN
jgi:hypothetical protein